MKTSSVKLAAALDDMKSKDEFVGGFLRYKVS